MKKFLYKTLLFSAPVLLLFLAIELFVVFKPNSFNTKAKYIQNNLDVEAVFLGSSHTQNGINPEFMHLKTANLAYGGQDYALDSALFFKYASKLQDLKYVFLEMDYHSLEHTNLTNYFKRIDNLSGQITRVQLELNEMQCNAIYTCHFLVELMITILLRYSSLYEHQTCREDNN
mgnify:CR=1 FL=1